MSYTLTKTDGTTLVTIPDTEINTSYGLTLIGRNYSGYGTFLNDNFISLMENFSNSTPPALPLEGQLWYNPDTYAIQVWDSRAWKQVAYSLASATQPGATGRNVGDMWYDTTNQQLFTWTGQIISNISTVLTTTGSTVSLLSSDNVRVGDLLTKTGGTPITTANNVVVTQILTSSNVQVNQAVSIASGETVSFTRSSGWYLIGPSYSKDQQVTGIFPSTVVDTQAIPHTVGLIYQHGRIIGAVSKDNEYVPAPAYAIDRLPVIKPGITLISDAAPQQVRTALANSSIVSAGTTVVGISSTDGIAIGDFVITANINYYQGVTVTGIFTNNSAIAIGANTIVSTNDLITFQRGVNESNMFHGTATNAQALNGVTADRFATLRDPQIFQDDVTVQGNLYVSDNITVWNNGGDISMINGSSNGDWNIYSQITGGHPSSSKVVQSDVGPFDGYSTLITVNSTNDLSVGDRLISANNLVGAGVLITAVFNANSQVMVSTADRFSSGEVIGFQRGINNQLRSIYVNGVYGNVEVARDPTSNMGVATKRYVDIAANNGLQAVAANVSALIGTAGISRRDFGNVSNIIDQFISNFAAVNAAVALRGNIDSQQFTGTPTSTTPADSDVSTRIATTQFVSNVANAILATTSANSLVQDAQILLRANIASPNFTGTPTAPTPSYPDRSTRLATTQWVSDVVDGISLNTSQNLSNKAPLADPHFSGVPTAPTAANLSYNYNTPGLTYSLNQSVSGGDSTLATTAFVANAIATMPAANLVPYATKVSPALEGIPTSTTAPSGTSNTWIATTRFVALNSPVLSVNNKTGNVSLGYADVTGAAPLSNPVFTGIPQAPEPEPVTRNLQIPTTSWVGNITANLAPKSNPTFTGTVLVPTPASTENGAIAATCAWVNTKLANASVPKWGGSVKFVSVNAPDDSQGNNGDLWFQYTT